MKTINLEQIERLSNFYGVELHEILDGNGNERKPTNPIHEMKPEEVSAEDFEVIAQFGKIIKNYKKIKRLHEESDREI